MNITISDAGIRNDSGYPFTYSSNLSSVSKLQPIKKTTESTDSVIREVEKAYVAENTPAYNISISSMGRAALNTLEAMKNNSQPVAVKNDFRVADTEQDSTKVSVYDTSVDEDVTPYALGEDVTDDDLTVQSTPKETQPVEEEESTQPAKVNNLTRYTESQLRGLVNDGTITRSDMENELAARTESSDIPSEGQAVPQILKQAVDAYNFQMAYQINAAIMQ